MKTTAALVLLLSVACASSTGVIDKRMFKCEPGQDIGIAAGFDDGSRSEEFGQREFLVQVANNSHNEVTVTSVRVEPSNRNRIPLDGAFQSEDVTIAEGEDHVFHLPTRVSLTHERTRDLPLDGRVVEFYVTVVLSNGDQYQCPFRQELR